MISRMGDRHKSPRFQGAVAIRQAEALKLFIAGHSYDQIAQRLNYADRSGAFVAVKRALEDVRAERTELAEHVLDTQIARYTDLYRRCIDALDEAEDGREVGRAQLISAARGCLDSLSRVYGIDANSAVVTVRTETQLDRDIAELTRMVTAIDSEAVEDEAPGA